MKPTLYLITISYDQIGHFKEYIDNFTKHLSDHYEIKYFVSCDGSSANAENAIELPIPNVSFREANFAHYGKFRRIVRAFKKARFSIKFYRLILKQKTISNDDIFYIMDYEYFSVIYFLFQLKRRKQRLLFWIHSASNKGSFIYYLYKTLAFILLKYFLRTNIIIVNGALVKQNLISDFGFNADKIEVVQYVSETTVPFEAVKQASARDQLELMQGETILLAFGMLRSDKKLDLTIQSVAAYNEKFTQNICLVIAGSESGVSIRDLNNWIEQSGLEHTRLLIKYVSEQEMHLQFSAADALIMTYAPGNVSQSGPASFARNYGLPIISTDVGEIGSYIKQNDVGFVADEFTEDSIASAIHDFMSLDDETRAELKDRILRMKDKFGWSSAAEKYKTILEELDY